MYVSKLRLKWLDTFLLLTSNGVYEDFAERAARSMSILSDEHGFKPQLVDVHNALARKQVRLKAVTEVVPVKSPLGAIDRAILGLSDSSRGLAADRRPLKIRES